MKIRELQEYMKENKIDLSIFMNSSLNKKDSNLIYFSQVDLEYATLAITQSKETLFVPRLEYENVKRNSVIKDIELPKKRISLSIKNKFKNKIKKIGVNTKILSLEEYRQLKNIFKGAKLVDISGYCSELRITKTKKEINYIKKACQITDKILQNCLNHFNFKTEAEVAAYLDSQIKKNGCEPAFRTIVASGKNASQPHYQSKDIKLNKGFCVIDFGAKYKNYCADITRTIFIGKPSQNEIKIYNNLLNAQQSSIERVKENMDCSQLDNFARKKLGKYGKNFIHSLGHGIGIDIHELPNVSNKAKNKLKNNMIFTIEPGIYVENKYGIRIEDDILLNKDKAEVLTKTTKELIKV